MSSHPLTRHAALLQALATHRVADLADVPEKTEVILGGMITDVQVKNVQKSRSGLTRMAKLTFEDLTGSIPAMLWPEEFAKNERPGQERPDRLRPGHARPPPRPGRADHQPDHPARTRPRRAVARGRRHAPQGGHPGRATSSGCSGRSASGPGNLDLYLEILGLAGVRRAIYKAGLVAARSATTTG